MAGGDSGARRQQSAQACSQVVGSAGRRWASGRAQGGQVEEAHGRVCGARQPPDDRNGPLQRECNVGAIRPTPPTTERYSVAPTSRGSAMRLTDKVAIITGGGGGMGRV